MTTFEQIYLLGGAAWAASRISMIYGGRKEWGAELNKLASSAGIPQSYTNAIQWPVYVVVFFAYIAVWPISALWSLVDALTAKSSGK